MHSQGYLIDKNIIKAFKYSRCIGALVSTFQANINSPWLISNIAKKPAFPGYVPIDNLTPFFWTRGRNAASNAGKSERLSCVPNRLHSPSDYNEMLNPNLLQNRCHCCPLHPTSFCHLACLLPESCSTACHYNDWHVLLDFGSRTTNEKVLQRHHVPSGMNMQTLKKTSA